MDTNKMRELKALAEAATGGKWVDASTALGGIVRGGPVQQWVNGSGQDQIVMATGAQWMQPDEPRANAAFIAAASPATVLALLAEIERHEAWRTAFLAERDAQMRQRDQLRAENEALRQLKLPHYLKLSDEMRAAGDHAELRAREDQCYSVPVLKAVFFEAAIQRWLDDQEEAIELAMAKEASHG